MKKMKVSGSENDLDFEQHLLNILVMRYDVDVEEIFMRRRMVDLLRIRQIYMFMLYIYTDLGISKICILSCRDHATVWHAIHSVITNAISDYKLLESIRAINTEMKEAGYLIRKRKKNKNDDLAFGFYFRNISRDLTENDNRIIDFCEFMTEISRKDIIKAYWQWTIRR